MKLSSNFIPRTKYVENVWALKYTSIFIFQITHKKIQEKKLSESNCKIFSELDCAVAFLDFEKI